VLWVKERTLILSFSIVFTFKLAFESFKECGGASQTLIVIKPKSNPNYN
jgi:hypothetical protein